MLITINFFVLGDIVPGDIHGGDFVQGDFVLIPFRRNDVDFLGIVLIENHTHFVDFAYSI